MIFKPGTGFVFSNYIVDTKKLNPFRVHFMRLFFPTLAHFACQRGAFKSTTRTELQIWETTIHIINIKTFKGTTRTELPFRLSPVILSHSYYDETIGWRLPYSMV